MRQIFCASLLALICFANAYSQTPSPAAAPAPSSQPSVQPDAEKIEVLKAQLELMRQYDQRLLDTVYYTLGALGAAVFLIITLGWYTNFRLYKRDTDAMKQEIAASLASEARQVAEKAVSQVFGEVEQIKYQLLEREAKEWLGRGVYENVLAVQVKMVGASQRLGYDWRTSRALGEMIDVLKSIIHEPKQARLDDDTVMEISKMLDTLPAGFSTDVGIIRDLVRSARAK